MRRPAGTSSFSGRKGARPPPPWLSPLRVRRRLAHVPISEDIVGPDYPEAGNLTRDVARAVAALPAHYRDVLLLRDLEGLSLVELSAQLGLSQQAAKARLHRARSLAREHLMA